MSRFRSKVHCSHRYNLLECLDVSYFGKGAYYCKECKKNRAKKDYSKDPEKVKVRVNAWKIENPVKVKDYQWEYMRNWLEENPGKSEEYYENWKKAHPKEYKARCKAFRERPQSMAELEKLVAKGKLKPLPANEEEY